MHRNTINNIPSNYFLDYELDKSRCLEIEATGSKEIPSQIQNLSIYMQY